MAVTFLIHFLEKQKAAMLSRLGWNLELSYFLKPAPILDLRRERKREAAKVAVGIKSCHG
jgi:hypothetical protein